MTWPKIQTKNIKVLTSVGFFSKTGSDTFRSVLVYGKEQQSRKNIFHNSAKKFNFLRRFDRRNTEKSNSKCCFHMALNARQSPKDSL